MQFGQSESSVLIEIEKFVDSVLMGHITFNEFVPYLCEIHDSFLSIYQSGLSYSAKVVAFQDAVTECESLRMGGCYDIELYQYFVGTLRLHVEAITKEKQTNIAQETSNKNSLQAYVGSLLQHYSRLLVVRVDLSYSKWEHSQVSIYDFKEHMATLLKYITNKRQCFAGLQGYAWALEQGEGKGYHCHLLLIYDGSKHQQDWSIGKQVGELWQNITQQQGLFFCCNHPEYKQNYTQRGMLGIGMIHRDNPHEVNNALRAASYLVSPEKSDQFLRVKTNKYMNTFSTGVYRNSKRRGLPPIV